MGGSGCIVEGAHVLLFAVCGSVLRVYDSGFRGCDLVFRVSGVGLKVEGFGCIVEGNQCMSDCCVRFPVQCLWFGVYGSVVRFLELRFRV